MSLALEIVCEKFGMKLADEPATRVVAQKIIELAQRGVRDANGHVEEHRYSPSVRRLRSRRFRSSCATAFSYRATAAS